jgi:glutaminyl-peptide cyclotransferase
MRIAINNKTLKVSLILLLLSIITITGLFAFYRQNSANSNIKLSIFNGERALEDVNYQVNLGARTPGSDAHAKTIDWIEKELHKNKWETEILTSTINGNNIQNIIGKKGNGRPWILLGVHYDSRIFANQDKDPEKQTLPVPGANDGASGVAVLLELSRMFNRITTEPSWAKNIWLVFFDAEDNGEISGWNWIMGSNLVAENLQEKPDVVVVLDMIGDADLNIYMETNSDDKYTKEIWKSAATLGYDQYFIPKTKYNIIDDHIPFIQKGIPSVDIIDFDYPYWHTTEDTADKVSAHSLMVVGSTIYTWLTENQQP